MCCRNNCTLRDRPDVLKTVNALLEKKYSAHKIEKLIGIGHSVSGRHSFHCWTKIAAEKIRLERERKRHPTKTKILIQWPDDPPIPANQLAENTLLIHVRYVEQDIQNPIGLIDEFGNWTEDAQIVFCFQVRTEVKEKFVLGEFENASRENYERNASKVQSALLLVSSNGNHALD